MWKGLVLALALCLLPEGRGETGSSGGSRCKPPPPWKIGELDPMAESEGKVTVVALFQASWSFCLVQASKLDRLRLKLEEQGLKNISYMVVNDKAEHARRVHHKLAEKLSEYIPLYGQDPSDQQDVWQLLKGEKDDFLIYDRCGRLTYHISLPYSILTTPHIENAIRATYCGSTCGNCSLESDVVLEGCEPKVDPSVHHSGDHHGHEHSHGVDHDHHHSHGHGHGHDSSRGHNSGHDHGHNRGAHRGEHGADHGHDHSHGHDHGQQQQQQVPIHHHDTMGQRRQQHVHHLLQQRAQYTQHQQHQQHQRAQAEGQAQAPVELGLELGQLGQAQVRHVREAKQEEAPWAHHKKPRWKAKLSWEWSNALQDPSSWCWHWRQLLDGGDGKALWHCDEALPASWQWQIGPGVTGSDGDHHHHHHRHHHHNSNAVRETWQWRPAPPAAWQQPAQPRWAWYETGTSATWVWQGEI